MQSEEQDHTTFEETERAMTTARNRMPAEMTENPFQEAGRESQRTIVGDILKFSKGDWLAGKENMELPMGTRLIANMDQLLRGWVRWEDNKPVEQIMGLLCEGYKPPARNTLGYGYTPETKKDADVDKSEWEVDEQSGQPRDPWQFTQYLVCRELDKDDKPLEGEGLYTFCASSKGAHDAIAELCRMYGDKLRVRPDDYPIITLGYHRYDHPNPKYGIIKTPEFIAGFVTPEHARRGKKVKLFNVEKDWIPKSMFGDIEEGAPMDGEEVPF